MISSAAEMSEWLKDHLGTGPLAGMFQRGGELVHCPRIGEDGFIPPPDDRDDDGPAQIRIVNPSTLASRIQLTYWCQKIVITVDDKGKKHKQVVPAMFPKAAAQVATDVPDLLPNLRPLRGVTHTPLVRADGTILSTPGYDPSTALLYLPHAGLNVPAVPDNPTSEQTNAALSLLRDMVTDFAFLTKSDEANYLGLALTPLLRELVPAPYKLGAIGAPQPGSGKTLLAACLRHLHGGVFRAEMPEHDAELRKSVTSILDVTTGPVVHFDNVSGVLRSSTLAGLLTSPKWDDRRLGVNSMVHARNDRLWLITGNNLSLGGDLVRRTLWITVDPGVPDPHLRTEFTIPNLEDWVHAHRGELLAALLTLVQSWVAAERPTKPRAGDGYARWIEAVDGILTHAGMPGTFDGAEAARQTVGSDDDDWRDFLHIVHAEFGDSGWTVKQLLAKVGNGTEADPDNGWRTVAPKPIPLDALPADLAEKASRSHSGVGSISKSLGRWLSNRDGRWAGGFTVRKTGEQRDGAIWRVQTIGEHQ